MDDEFYQKLLGFGLNFVSIRPRSEKEIREYILKKIRRWQTSSAYFDRVINRLHELGYVDDFKFACAFINSRNLFRPKGSMLIRMELKKKGVKEEIIDKALKLSIQDTENNEVDLARLAAKKRLRGLQRYNIRERRNKLYAFLMRRGFNHDIISAVIDEVT